MRTIGRILGLLFGVAILGGIASALAALVMRDRLASTGGSSDDEFDLVTIFDGLEFRSRAPALRRASSLTWYGGGTIDLRDATLDPDGATLGVRTIFGGLQLVVPATWRVETNVISIAGGIGDTRDPARVEASAPVLRVTGWNLFGGIGIVDEDEAAAPA